MLTITQKTAARYLVGRRIVSVEVDQMSSDEMNEHTRAHWAKALVLDDGSRITFFVREMANGFEYVVELMRHARPGDTP